MRSRVGAAALVLALAGVSGLAGCGDDDPAAGYPEGPSTSSGSASGTSPTDPSTTTTDTPPATGRLMTAGQLTLHLPAGMDWRVSDGGRSAAYYDRKSGLDWRIRELEIRDTTSTLDEVADVVRRGFATHEYPGIERLENRTVAGQEGWVLQMVRPPKNLRVGFYYEYGTVKNDHWVRLQFEFPDDTDRARDIVESVLASVEWK